MKKGTKQWGFFQKAELLKKNTNMKNGEEIQNHRTGVL